MNEAVIIVGTLSAILSVISLVLGCVSIAMVSGFLRSTHTIAWKPLDPIPAEEEEEPSSDPFLDNLKKELKRPKDFPFMEDITENNNF